MPRQAPIITLTEEEAKTLKATANSRVAEFRQVERARIVLACATGKPNKQVAEELGVTIPTVGKWRTRFAEQRLSGLRDSERSGKPPTYGPEFRNRLLKLLEENPPRGTKRWNCPALARQLDASTHAVWRQLRKEGIYLHRSKSWSISTNPEFTAKAVDIAGLYLSPPVNALVLSVGEPPGIQTEKQEAGLAETKDKNVYRGYKKMSGNHGSLNLFAALKVASGYAHARIDITMKVIDFREFIENIVDGLVDESEVHVILENYSTLQKNDKWLKNKYDSKVHFHFTPTSESWFNQVEIWFSILSLKHPGEKDFTSADKLTSAIQAFTTRYHTYPTPFKWRKGENTKDPNAQ